MYMNLGTRCPAFVCLVGGPRGRVEPRENAGMEGEPRPRGTAAVIV
jgi:hypothetical protein